jgi:hypothetical protein
MNHVLHRAVSFCVLGLVIVGLSGCATGQAFKTTILEGGRTMTYESKTTGVWFYSKPTALLPSEDTLELK